MVVPAQAIEDRNKPHTGRAAQFLRENSHTLNEPVNRVNTKGIVQKDEGRWWEWNNAGLDDRDPQWKNKKRSSSAAKADQDPRGGNQNGGVGFNDGSGGSGFQTTYQKEHGYLKNFQMKGADVYERHSMNPNTQHAVGIVPVTDLSTYSKANEQQRVFVDKMSFEHGYDSRKEDNYALRGKRPGAYVTEQVEPKPAVGLKQRPNLDRGSSMWDAMHHTEAPTAPQQLPPRPQLKPPSGKASAAQRRDPIGYFDDGKFGGSLGQEMTNLNPGPSFNPHLQANTREYNPSWQQPPMPVHDPVHGYANELLENAMRYQRPLAAEEY